MIKTAFKKIFPALDNQEGSIIVIALMVLAIMTVIGLMSGDEVVTENFIIRNTGIHKQNVNLVEAAVMEGLMDVMLMDPDNLDPDTDPSDWINDDDDWDLTDWYDPLSGRLLDASNSDVPDMILNDDADSVSILQTRGEDDNDNLRIAVLGWETHSGESEKMPETSYPLKDGRIMGEYISMDAGDDNGYGMLRMEIGIKRRF